MKLTFGGILVLAAAIFLLAFIAAKKHTCSRDESIQEQITEAGKHSPLYSKALAEAMKYGCTSGQVFARPKSVDNALPSCVSIEQTCLAHPSYSGGLWCMV